MAALAVMVAALAWSAPQARAQLVDPFTEQEQKLSGSDLIGFGWSVAMSADGTTALVGAPFYRRAWVYTRSGQGWIQQGRPLFVPDSHNFGMSVALSSDGNTALVGDPGNSDGVGAVWAFTRSGSTWTRQGPKLTGAGEVGDGLFGIDVALSADGNTALVGGSSDDGGAGAAWAFTRSGQTWTQQGPKLTGSGAVGDAVFGFSVALSSDGNTALVGGPSDNGDAGAAWAFTRSGQTWAQQGSKLTPADAVGAAKFGQSVALSGDGNKALIGGPDDRASPGTTPGIGAAWVFIRSGQTWGQLLGKLTGAQESGAGGFGTGVALSADGNTAFVGAQHDDGARGAAWVFVATGPQGQTWVAQGLKLVPEGNSASSFGASVALSGDGNTALAGGLSDGVGVGAAWVFTRSAATWSRPGPKLTLGSVGPARFGESVAMDAEGVLALIGAPDDGNGVGAVWLVGRSSEEWALEGPKLTGSGTVGAAKFGLSVALSLDGTTALVGAPEDDGGAGAAWVFAFTDGSWVQQGPKLTGSDAVTAANFGHGVALSADGDMALIGGPADGEDNAGAAGVFTRSGQTWTQQGPKLKGSGVTGAGRLGWSVALSGDGGTALIGGPFDDTDGAAWVFTRSGQTWTQQGSKLTGSGALSSAFGAAVALSSDGNTALVGGPQDNPGAGAA